MAEIVDFGLQQHKIKMDSRYFENVLTVVAGDTGRRIEVQLLDTNGTVQDTTGLNLRLNAVIAGKATFTDATLIDATTGKYQLDLSNGMFLAPGNWQFQWQVTDSAGKKLHSFAFTGNVGSNISEGGSQATNFYLNLEDLKAMQDDLVNGTFNSEALETNIAKKLETLEETYAPRLTEVTAQLAETGDDVAVANITGLNVAKPLYINTFSPTDEPYHPSVEYFENGWNGFKYWMAYTPYPYEHQTPYKDRWESPSIAVSNDGITWETPNGLINPIVDLSQMQIDRYDYYSDPSTVMNGEVMEVWYRHTNGSNIAETNIYRIVSTDGVSWSEPEMVVDSKSATEWTGIVRSQQVLFDGMVYKMYWDHGSASGNRKIVFAESSDPSSRIWTNFTECNLVNAPSGFNNWHTSLFKEGSLHHFVSYDNRRKTLDYFTSQNGIDLDFIATILEPTSNITDYYQTSFFKTSEKWVLYTSVTKNNKNGIMLLRGKSLLALEVVNGARNEEEQSFQGDIVLGNSSRTDNPSQYKLVTLKSDNESYGYGMNMQKKEPVWITQTPDYKQEILTTISYGNPDLVLPKREGQFLKDALGEMYVSVNHSGRLLWSPVIAKRKNRIAANTTIDVQGVEIVYLSATMATSIEKITGGIETMILTLINTTNHEITLKHTIGENCINTQTKTDYALLSSSSVQLMKVKMDNGQMRWHII